MYDLLGCLIFFFFCKIINKTFSMHIRHKTKSGCFVCLGELITTR